MLAVLPRIKLSEKNKKKSSVDMDYLSRRMITIKKYAQSRHGCQKQATITLKFMQIDRTKGYEGRKGERPTHNHDGSRCNYTPPGVLCGVIQ